MYSKTHSPAVPHIAKFRGSQLETCRPGLYLRRTPEMVQPGLLRIAQEITVSSRQSGLDVTGPFWMCGLVRILRGTVRYRDEEQWIQPGGRFYGVFLPPFSIGEAILHRSRTFSVGYLGSEPLPSRTPRRPVIFRPPLQRLPASCKDVFSLLAKADRFQPISRVENPPNGARQLKDTLDQVYVRPLRIGQIAQALGIAPSVASRNFRRAYHMSPSQYRQSLRVLESMMRLAQGQAILDVSTDVGFGDLSRFYEHFRRVACAPPGRYRPH